MRTWLTVATALSLMLLTNVHRAASDVGPTVAALDSKAQCRYLNRIADETIAANEVAKKAVTDADTVESGYPKKQALARAQAAMNAWMRKLDDFKAASDVIEAQHGKKQKCVGQAAMKILSAGATQ